MALRKPRSASDLIHAHRPNGRIAAAEIGLGQLHIRHGACVAHRAVNGTSARYVARVRARSYFLPRLMGGPAASDARGSSCHAVDCGPPPWR